ncbi:MAG: hypothetical protein Q3994_00920 [Prevotella sp.]|nr:hypothetical protein [Prevotella sp.]
MCFCIFISFVCVSAVYAQQAKHYIIDAYGFRAGAVMEAPADSNRAVRFSISQRTESPFCQSVVKQTRNDIQAPTAPYYHARFALPIPSCYTPTEQGALAGLDEGVYHHLHSAGFDIMPNGDLLAVYFSTPMGKSEADTSTTFVQARLRYGADEWDFPELFFRTRGGNDQSALLWRDGRRVWFFGGGRDISDWVPFRYCVTEDNGITWTYSLPKLSAPAKEYTAQPISNAFRASDGRIFMASDGKNSTSFLWCSADDGYSWTQQKGRTGTRHSTIVPLDSNGTLLAIAGKNHGIDRWNVQNISHDWGETWSEDAPSPFPQLGTAQRPCMIRLKSGRLLVVIDSYLHKKKIAPPQGWQHGNECVTAISDDNGATWRIKALPLTLPQHHRVAYPSLGYVTLRQGDDGMIHILTTTNYPGLHITFNEAWLDTDESLPTTDMPMLNGKDINYFPSGKKQHEVTWKDGRKTGIERFWREDGTLRWTWKRDLKKGIGIWTQYYPNGKKRVQSTWNINPTARDRSDHHYSGYVAEGSARHWDEKGHLTHTYMFHNGVTEDDGQVSNTGILNEGK